MSCQDEPSGILVSICLAGITIAEHRNKPNTNSQTRFGPEIFFPLDNY
ncbi:hypothetical protein GGD38_002544 [Chitinophagaceae bacterium OAS944]|nr:hypothetical protein [Chitinophagaceae bacterium OAS944]